MAKVITGTNGADNIKVWESGVTVNAGAGGDTIHLKRGTGSTVHGEAGDDTIYIHAGGAHTVYGGAGDDVMVTWGNAGDGSRFEGGNGNDSFKIKGGNNHVIIMGDGSLNTVNLDKGSGHSITGGNTGVDRLFICSDDVTNVTANLKNGENRATLWGGSDNTITGGADTDIFNVKGGKKNSLYGGAGKDYLIIHAGEQNSIYGGDGDDRLTVWQNSGDKNNLYGEGGNDIIEVNGGNEHRIDGGDGYNQVKLKGGDRHTYTGGSGKDLVYISGGNGHTVNAGDGENRITVYTGEGHVITGGKNTDIIDIKGGSNSEVAAGSGTDYITISGGTGHKVDGGDGNDTIRVTGGENHQINGGAGDDTFVISSAFTSATSISIDQTNFATGDKDVLQLQSLNHDALAYTLDEGVLTITDNATGGKVTVAGWDVNPLASIKFKDATVTKAEIIAALQSDNIILISKNGTYNATSRNDIFRFSGSGWNVILTNTDGNDKLDFSQYNDGEYGIGDYYRTGNDLCFTYLQYSDAFAEGEKLIGRLTIKNYFTSANKISQFTYYDHNTDTVRTLALRAGENGGDTDDIILAMQRNSTLDGGAGNDILYGTEGTDYLYGGAGDDVIESGEGSDKLYGGEGNDRLYGDDGNDTIEGGSGDDIIKGGRGKDNLYGGEGNDFLYGDDGSGYSNYGVNSDDVIEGGEGKDYLYGGYGDDTLSGDAGDDVIEGGDGNDTLNGGKGNDTLYGDYGDDTLNGGEGNDTLYGGSGNDTLSGDAGDDVIEGGNGNDILTGGTGNDIFIYASGNGEDTITDYEEGIDTVHISEGVITNTKLANDDTDVVLTIGYFSSSGITLQNAAEKVISLKDSRGKYTVSGDAIVLGADFTGEMDSRNYLSTVTTIDGRNIGTAVSITGNAQDNTIYGSSGSDTLNGGDGDDVLYGGDGNDSLAGDKGNNILVGGSGNDTFVFSGGNDTIKDYEEGQDTLFFSQFNTMIQITKTTLLNNGNDFMFKLRSNRSVTLENVAGKTIHIQDYYQGGLWLSDKQIVLDADFNDFIAASTYFPSITLIDGRKAEADISIHSNNKDSIIYGGYGSDELYGNNGDDIIYGGDGDDVISGSNGNDTLYGGKGNDHFYCGTGVNNLYGGEDDDIFSIGTSKSSTIFDYGNGNDVVDIGYNTINSTEILENDLLLNLGTGYTVTLKNAVGQEILYMMNGTDDIYTLRV